jgi:hypothetical protein
MKARIIERDPQMWSADLRMAIALAAPGSGDIFKGRMVYAQKKGPAPGAGPWSFLFWRFKPDQ